MSPRKREKLSDANKFKNNVENSKHGRNLSNELLIIHLFS